MFVKSGSIDCVRSAVSLEHVAEVFVEAKPTTARRIIFDVSFPDQLRTNTTPPGFRTPNAKL